MARQLFSVTNQGELRKRVKEAFQDNPTIRLSFSEHRTWSGALNGFREVTFRVWDTEPGGRITRDPVYIGVCDIVNAWSSEFIVPGYESQNEELRTHGLWIGRRPRKRLTFRKILSLIDIYNQTMAEKIMQINVRRGRHVTYLDTFAFALPNSGVIRVKQIGGNSGFCNNVAINLEGGMNIRDAIASENVKWKSIIDIPIADFLNEFQSTQEP